MNNIFNHILNQKAKFKYIEKFNCTDIWKGIKAITFDGEEYQGKKTKVFAYIGFPKKITSKVPAVVLVHGGGCHAYCEWVRIWNERGYAAIAMDNTGFFPKRINAGNQDTAEDNDNWARELNGLFDENGYICGPNNVEMSDCDLPIKEQWMYHAVATVIKSRNIIESFEVVDKDNIGLIGISWGGVIASITIGFDDNYKFAVPIYGCGFMRENMGFCGEFFRKENVQWFAEENFQKVKTPVLWLCWDDDCAFSINTNSKSFIYTRKNNEKTKIAIVDGMEHCSSAAWNREEPYVFADNICLKEVKAPIIIDYKLDANSLECLVENVENCKVYLYYKKNELRHQMQTKYGQNKLWPAEEFNVIEDEIKDYKIKIVLPKDAKGVYLAIKTTINNKEYVTSTPYLPLH